MALHIVRLLLTAGEVEKSEIGILSWYDGQTNRLRKIADLHGVVISNVDGFQGSERGVMLLSTVRSNKRNDLGIVKHPNRLNVAVTRAKRGLIVLGNYQTLKSGDTYGH